MERGERPIKAANSSFFVKGIKVPPSSIPIGSKGIKVMGDDKKFIHIKETQNTNIKRS